MSTALTVFFICFFMFLLLMVLYMPRYGYYRRDPFLDDGFDDEEEVVTTHHTTTTTTTVDTPAATQASPQFAGEIVRQWYEETPYIYDPVDNTLQYLDPHDDLYDDANGKTWRVVDA